jgi:AraC-like DNA-binding protein
MDSQLRMKEIVYALLCNAVCPDTKEKSLTQTDSIIDYICENICDPSLSVKFLCEKFYISESQLRRNFLNQTGMKPNEYITNIRLNLAKNELAYTSKSIMTVSEFCGFSSPYYFSNCFSRHTGMSPSQFRKHISCKL